MLYVLIGHSVRRRWDSNPRGLAPAGFRNRCNGPTMRLLLKYSKNNAKRLWMQRIANLEEFEEFANKQDVQ